MSEKLNELKAEFRIKNQIAGVIMEKEFQARLKEIRERHRLENEKVTPPNILGW